MRWLGWFFDIFCVRVPAPRRPSFDITFSPSEDDPMSLIGTVTPKPADTAVLVAKRTVTVALDGGTPVTLDATAGSVTFPVEDGQTCVITMVDTSAGGVPSPPTTVTIVAHDTVTEPAAPGFDVTFAPAPTPPAPPAS